MERTRLILELFEIIMSNPPLDPPPAKTFKPKCDLPVLKSYHFGAPDSYWEKFPMYRNIHGRSPYKLNADLLLKLAEQYNVTDIETVRAVCRWDILN